MPIKHFNIGLALALLLQRIYAEHKDEDRYRAGLYWKSYFLFRSMTVIDQNQLGGRIISDDLLVSRISPKHETRQLLGSAIAACLKKHWVLRYRSMLKSGFGMGHKVKAPLDARIIPGSELYMRHQEEREGRFDRRGGLHYHATGETCCGVAIVYGAACLAG
jgi:hypothetical protein